MSLRTFLAAVLLLAGRAPAWAQGSEAPPAPLEARLKLVAQINRDRAEAGRTPVEYSPELSAAADAHCAEMLRENYTSHWNRAGLKPYMRYAVAGLREATSENVASFWCSGCDFGAQHLLARMLESHASFMAEKPPLDGHRQSVLDPNHTHVGIGVAYGANGMRMIELFSARHAELFPMPLQARLNAGATVSGRVSGNGLELNSISIYYEPLPEPMTLAQLKATYAYGMPDEEHTERPELMGLRTYVDGSRGRIRMGAGGRFEVPLFFWKSQPGVYTVTVWVRRANTRAFPGAQASIFVDK
jgi:uncharacterized protein YkwD